MALGHSFFLAPPPLRFAQRALPHQRGGANYHCWLQGAIALGVAAFVGLAYLCLSLPLFAYLASLCLSLPILAYLAYLAYLCLSLPILPTLPIAAYPAYLAYLCLPLPIPPTPKNKRGCAFQRSPICIIYSQLRLLAPDVEALGLTAVHGCVGRKLVSCILEVVYVSSYCRR